MEMVREFFYSTFRQGLPIVGAVTGMVWAAADGTPRSRGSQVGRALMFSGAGWAGGYIVSRAALWVMDRALTGRLPSETGTLHGHFPAVEPVYRQAGGGMPNSSQDFPMDSPQGMPPATVLPGEESQSVDITSAGAANEGVQELDLNDNGMAPSASSGVPAFDMGAYGN